MDWLRAFAPTPHEWIPLLVTLGIVALALAGAEAILRLRERRTRERPTVGRQLVMLGATAVGVSAVILTLPLSESLRERLLGLLGIVLTGVIGFSSTTFVANAMAGLMLRAHVLDALHAANVEIVSPTFMNQRRIDAATRFVPPARAAATPGPEAPPPEALIFDEADQKASLEALRVEREKLLGEVAALTKSAGEAAGDERIRIDAQIERLKLRMEAIARELQVARDKEHADDSG